jgi:hypothetical protein
MDGDTTMGKLTWNGWVTSWDQIRRAPQPTSIIMGKNLIRNAPTATTASDIEPTVTDEDLLDTIAPSQEDVNDLNNATDERHFEISFPIAPIKSDHETSTEG